MSAGEGGQQLKEVDAPGDAHNLHATTSTLTDR